jgi:hypothetical protein
MKFNYCIILILLYSSKGYSQITKNNWLMGGQLSFDHSKTTTDQIEISSTVFQGKPNVGYFFIDKLAGGIEFDLIYNVSKISSKTRVTTLGIGPFIRYYFLNTDSRINVVSDARVAFNMTSTNQNALKNRYTSYSFSAGPAVFFNSSVAMELLIGYTGYQASTSSNNGVRVSIGFQIHLERDR